MVSNKKVTGAATTIPLGLSLGLALSILITLAGAALIAYLMLKESVPENAVGYTSMIVLALASMAGSWLAAARIKRLRVQICMIAGACYYIFLLACTAMFFGGEYTGMGITAIIVFLSSAVVASIGVFGKKGLKIKGRKPVYR